MLHNPVNPTGSESTQLIASHKCWLSYREVAEPLTESERIVDELFARFKEETSNKTAKKVSISRSLWEIELPHSGPKPADGILHLDPSSKALLSVRFSGVFSIRGSPSRLTYLLIP